MRRRPCAMRPCNFRLTHSVGARTRRPDCLIPRVSAAPPPAHRRGNTALLTRSAHGADIHPCQPRSILVVGGYGGVSSTYVWMNDVFILHTDRWEKKLHLDERYIHSAHRLEGTPRWDGSQPLYIPNIAMGGTYNGACLPRYYSPSPPPPLTPLPLSLTLEPVFPRGPCPSPRGYHSLTTFGARHCVVIGGRTEEGRIQGGQMVAVYDAAGDMQMLDKLFICMLMIADYDAILHNVWQTTAGWLYPRPCPCSMAAAAPPRSRRHPPRARATVPLHWPTGS